MAVQQLPQPIRNAPIVDGQPWVFSQFWGGWLRKLYLTFNGNLEAGATSTIPLAKLTAGGSNGSLTVTNGIITNIVAPS
jgi:hypothetical protein